MHLLLGSIVAERALELRLFAALPFDVIPQGTLKFVSPAAASAFDALLFGAVG